MATFYFSRETPSDSFYRDIQALNRLSSDQFSEISSLVLQLCLDPAKGSRVIDQLEEFSTTHGVAHSSIKTIFKTLLAVTNGALKTNLSSEQLQEDLSNLGLENERASHMAQQWAVNKSALSKSALSQTLMVNQLVDMEWKFGVTAASSDLNKVGNTFLQLKLLINKGNKMETVYMELSLNQFYSFLHEMEKAKTSLDYFS